jgi:REP element-mobilizing transposase RayT
MPFDPEARHRRSIRLPGYDYTSAGAYFVTLVAKDRECLFEHAANRTAVERAWLALPATNSHVKLDIYVVMPNHFHGILWLDGPRRGGSRTAPTDALKPRKPLGRLIGAFKTTSTKAINLLRDSPGVPVWQRNYYERIIRNEAELNRIRQYILDNPANWAEDAENPTAPAKPRLLRPS